MNKAILFLLVLTLCLLCGCSIAINKAELNSSSESSSESENSLVPDVASESSVSESSVSSEESSISSKASSAASESPASSKASSASSAAQSPSSSSAASSSASNPPQKEIKAPNDYYVSLDYYLDSGFYGNKENAMLLSGETIDTARIILVYTMKSKYDLMRDQSEVDAFLQDYDNGVSLSEMCEQNGSYYAALSDGGVAFLELKNGVLRVSAVAGPFNYDFPSKVSNYDGNATSAKYLVITRTLHGILVSDGSSESFIVLESIDPFNKKFKVNTLYPVSDIVEFIRSNKDLCDGF